ncbi:MAG: hypothetical protein IJX63_03790 [Lachnospiraceae bacterium]|nr:hypothetical protein [Lachnospiraceae bacterium]
MKRKGLAGWIILTLLCLMLSGCGGDAVQEGQQMRSLNSEADLGEEQEAMVELVTEVLTPEQTEAPMPEPTEAPTPEPTEAPTPEPIEAPTPEPTEVPTPEPTEVPTPEPTEVPTLEPTEAPTPEPTEAPAPEPTETPIPASKELPTPGLVQEPIAESIKAYAVNNKNGKIHMVGQCSATGTGKNAMEEPVYFSTYEEAEAYSASRKPKLEKRKCGNCW